jgi:electron transfer flavoprotein alpha/beta subunit
MAQAAVLAALARCLTTPLVVLCDTPRGLLGAATAEHLGLPLLSQVLGAELVEEPNLPLRVIRRCLHGVQQLRGPVAAVLSVVPGSEEPVGAQSEPPPRWSLGELGLTAADLPRPLLRQVLPAQRATFPAKQFATLDELVEQLRQDGLG